MGAARVIPLQLNGGREMAAGPGAWNADCQDEGGCTETASFPDDLHGAASLLTWLASHRHEDNCVVISWVPPGERSVERSGARGNVSS